VKPLTHVSWQVSPLFRLLGQSPFLPFAGRDTTHAFVVGAGAFVLGAGVGAGFGAGVGADGATGATGADGVTGPAGPTGAGAGVGAAVGAAIGLLGLKS